MSFKTEQSKPHSFLLPSESYDEAGDRILTHQERREDRKLTFWHWVFIVVACVVGGFYLANFIYKPKINSPHNLLIGIHFDSNDKYTPSIVSHSNDTSSSDLSLYSNSSDLMVLDKRVNLNPFSTFKAGNAGVKVGLIVGGVTTFNTGVSNCDQGNYFSCVTGIISGLLLTAVGLYAPVPAAGRRRSLEEYANMTITMGQYDPLSTHPAHRFITNYQRALAANPALAEGARVGSVSYAKTGLRRHRLIVVPKSTGIGRRQDASDNDGNSVSYEWTDFGAGDDGADTNSDDYNSVAGGVAGYLQDNQANNICLTQCAGYEAYEIGQLQTQAGTDPDYDADCEFSEDMDECP